VLNIGSPAQLADDGALDVTPIMNMFIILIPFLVSMAVFSHLSVLQFALPADGGSGRISDELELPLTIAMTTEKLAVTRGESILASIALNEGAYDFTGLQAVLRSLQAEDGGREDLVLAVDDAVVFNEIVACMDHCREAGFTEIGLAAGTNLDQEAGHVADQN
jgi:biopolymer transport protein ExbD